SRKRAAQLHFVPQTFQFVSSFRGKAIFHLHVTSGERKLREAWRLKGRLNVHLEVDQVRYKLNVRLRLVPPAHDSKRHPRITLLPERRNNRLQRPLASRQRIRRLRVQNEQSAAIVQYKARSLRDNI